MHTNPATAHAEPDVAVVGKAAIYIIDTAAGPVEFPGRSGMNVAVGVGRPRISTTPVTALDREWNLPELATSQELVQTSRKNPHD